MSTPTKILFIINPISGTTNKEKFPELIKKEFEGSNVSYELKFTKYAGEASEIAKNSLGKYDIIVAVGGDGTINEIARPLIHSQTVLGIIPKGSGNGLARHLGIPLAEKKALRALIDPRIELIDTLKLDKQEFLNVAGVGFDAHVAHLFSKSKKRGFLTYSKLVLRELRRFKFKGYKLEIDGETFVENSPFLISIANSTQYGNNAKIAPMAKTNDGLMDICILQKVPFWYYPILGFHLFNGSLNRSKYYACLQGKSVRLSLLKKTDDHNMHLDGDSYAANEVLNFSIEPASLKIALPK